MTLESGIPPAAALAIALLAGVVLAPTLPPVGAHVHVVPWALAIVALRARGTRPRLAAVLLLACALALGISRGAAERDSASERTGWLPIDGVSAELHLYGVVVSSPEPDPTGERLLLLRVRPESESPARASLNVLFRVGVSSTSSTRRLDALAAGDRVRVWARVRRPRSPGNPGERDARARLRARGLDAIGSVKSAELIELLGTGEPSAARSADRVRTWARERLDRALGSLGRSRALVGALVLGDRGLLSAERQRTLRRAGLAHLVAISGLHVGLVLWAVHASLRRALGLRGWPRLCVSLGLLGGFALLVGGRASVWRAVLAAGAWLAGRRLGREGTAMSHLAIVAAVIAWLRPWSPGGAGFQLTFLAVAGIVGFAGRIRAAIPLPASLGLGPAVGLSAYLATAPALAWHFGWLAPIGLITNLVALPVCACLLAAGFALIALCDWPVVGWIAAAVCEGASSVLWWISNRAASWEPGAIAVSRPGTALLWVYYASLGSAGLQRLGPSLRRVNACTLGLLSIWLHLGAPPSPPAAMLEVRVLDVGQGLAVALRGKSGRVVLFDTGGSARSRFDPGERIVVPSLLARSGRRIEALVLSHGDVDHAGGALAVLGAMEVGELWLGPESRGDALLNRVREAAAARGVPVVLAERGRSFRVDGIPFRVLGPDRSRDGPGDNDGSVVVLAGERPHRVLLPGDLERRGEAELLASHEPLRTEVLIVAHHGSRTGSCDEFLWRAAPEWAVVSAGYRNRFGHPHPDVLERLKRVGAASLRTDLHGAVSLRAVESGWQVLEFRATERSRAARE